MLHTQWVSVIEFRKPLTFYTELEANPHLAPEEDIIFVTQVRKQIFPFLEKETISLSSQAVCYTNILKKNLKTKVLVILPSTVTDA